MRSSIIITSSLLSGVLAWPSPQLLDVNLSAGLGLFPTVTVTKPAVTVTKAAVTITKAASTCLPTSKTPLAPSPSPTPGRVTGIAQAFISIGVAYQAAILFHHNTARANHGALPLSWDASCEANARLAASTCNYAPYLPAGVNQGQNLFATSGAFNVTAAITETWYKKELSAMAQLYGVASIPATTLPSVSHLTQMVWKGTTKIGCASVDCGSRMKVNGAPSTLNKYTVCNYAPAGNIGGQFALNVGRPKIANYPGKWTD